MRGIWLEDRRLHWRTDLERPAPGENEVLVRVVMAGICHTDLELLRGYSGFEGVPGHEFVGVVASSTDAGPPLGTRVVGEINAACDRCVYCLTGRRRHCPNRSVLGISGRNGAFTEYLQLPRENLHQIADHVSDLKATFAEPLAAAYRILEQAFVGPGERVLLMGAGKLGQLIARVLLLAGCDLVVLARHRRQQELLERLGMSVETDPQLDWRKSFDTVIEATGSAEALASALEFVHPEGRIIVKSTYADRVNFDLSRAVVDEVEILGSRCGPFPPAVRALELELIDPSDLVEAVYPLEEYEKAFERAARPGALKVLLQIGGG
ncbi:MAG TPA: alcohol dehydrogenase catalytic domain-containing protein [Acidobacteriota bacterium]|nr:alcohol dehydrogenase catalytic domain-containing protein [Acidobacteriota bacterium]HRR55887.1 alcohol dehydrogenase catalytic domain-containing protein [Acidobacteriota bacterium]HRV06972.1 alcohol dehydrogenase catalytic domain-containing protein [Acidobacteriota bacterium]